MQKLFMALSFFFVFSYANNEISGYTESILESINGLNSDYNTPALKPQRGGAHGPVLITEGYETPINPFSGEILPIAFKSTIPIITEGPDNENGFDGLPSDCYENVSIQLASSTSATPSSTSSSSTSASFGLSSSAKPLPKYCYDDNIIEKNLKSLTPMTLRPMIFISSKIGGKVSFIVSNLSSSGALLAYDKYHVEQVKRFKDKDLKKYTNQKPRQIDEDKRPDGSVYTINIDNIAKGGIYHIVGDYTAKGKLQHEIIAKVKILPYDPIERKFYYLQFDGGETLQDNLYPNNFKKIDVEKNLNDIYKKQAVIEYKALDGNKKTDEIKNKLYEIDMTDLDAWEDDGKAPFMKTINSILSNLNVTTKLQSTEASVYKLDDSMKKLNEEHETNPSALAENPKMHIAIAINKERLLWYPYKCAKGTSKDKDPNDLSNCFRFNPEDEESSTEYYIKERKNLEIEQCKKVDETKITQVEIRSFLKLDEEGKPSRSYYAYSKEDGKRINFNPCKIIYTDNAYPVIPLPNALKGGTQAASLRLNNKYGFNVNKGYLAYGSLVIVPRSKGPSGYNTISHELGHSYGLTDVAIQPYFLYSKSEHAKVTDFTEDKIKDITVTKDMWTYYDNIYATSEANVMGWHTPLGNKIRYRETPITCTGGKKVTIKIHSKEEVKTFSDEDNYLKGKGEKQWDCMRNCYTAEHAENENRKEFWISDDKKIYSIKETNGCNLVIDPDNDKEKMTEEEFMMTYDVAIAKEYYELGKLKEYYPIDELAEYFSIDKLKPFYSTNDLIEGLLMFLTIDDLKPYFSSDELKPFL